MPARGVQVPDDARTIKPALPIRFRHLSLYINAAVVDCGVVPKAVK